MVQLRVLAKENTMVYFQDVCRSPSCISTVADTCDKYKYTVFEFVLIFTASTIKLSPNVHLAVWLKTRVD